MDFVPMFSNFNQLDIDLAKRKMKEDSENVENEQ